MKRWMTLLVVAAAPALLAQETKPGDKRPEEPKMEAKKPDTQPADKHMFVKLETTLGDIVLDLDAEKAPISVKNFLGYVDAGFYNGTIFHRVVSDFMIQGGGMTPDVEEKKQGLQPPIKNEWQNGLKNVRGTIAMARTGVADSATAQFFINVADNNLGKKYDLDSPRPQAGNAAYAVFGKVIAGTSVVDKIRFTPVQESPKLVGMGKVVPLTPVVIKSTKRLTAEEAKSAVTQAMAADKEAEAAEAQRRAEAGKAETGAKAGAEKQVQDFIKKVEQETGKKVEKTSSGLMYVVLKEGTGANPKPTDTVEVHYTGTFLDGKKFDSSVDRGQPATFPLNGVIKGWTEGVGLMKVGEKRKLIVPPDLAYGPQGRPGIPPNSTLVFDVELLSIK